MVNDKELKKAEDRLSHLEGEISHYGRLIEALGNPSEWKYTGKMIDAGEGVTYSFNPPRCACGHPIRFIFIIEHPQKGQTQLGSVCIGHFKYLNPTLYANLSKAATEMEERLKEEKRKIEFARKQKEVEELKLNFDSLYNEIMEEYLSYRNQGLKAPYGLWATLNHYYLRVPRVCPRYKRVAAYKRWYLKQITMLLDRKRLGWEEKI